MSSTHLLEYKLDPLTGFSRWFVDGRALDFRAFPTDAVRSMVTTASMDDVRYGWVLRCMNSIQFEINWRPGYDDLWPILFPGVRTPNGSGQYWSQLP